MAFRREDVVGKAAVVRQQDETGAGLVQPPGREQLPPGIGIPHQIHDRRVPLTEEMKEMCIRDRFSSVLCCLMDAEILSSLFCSELILVAALAG